MSSAATMLSTVEDRVLSESVVSPQIALIRLGLEIDRQLRLLLAVSDKIREYKTSNPPVAATLLQDWLAPDLIRSIEAFWRLRESILRSGDAVPSSVLVSAVDSGLRILRTLAAIPRPKLVVAYPNVPLFTDQECTQPRNDVHGILLEWVDPVGRPSGSSWWYPTQLSYSEGQNVSWEWLPPGSGMQGFVWYRDPQTKNLQPVDLSFYMEFIGRDLATI